MISRSVALLVLAIVVGLAAASATPTLAAKPQVSMVKDITPGNSTVRTALGCPYDLTNVDDTLFFNANGALWKSDGTKSGTVMVSEMSAYSYTLTSFGGLAFFRANDGVHGYELWKSDGTSSGTVMVKDINPGDDDSRPWLLTNVDGTLYFGADDGVHGRELWKSDGTESGTTMVKDIGTGPGTPLTDLTGIADTLFFVADDGMHGPELWRTDGSELGTEMLTDLDPGFQLYQYGDGTYDWKWAYLTGVKETLYFAADDGIHGEELWMSDGTPEGTMLAADIRAGTSSSSPVPFGVGTLFVRADDGIHGFEPWTSTTDSEIVMLKDLNPGPDTSDPGYATEFKESVYFSAYGGTALWKSALWKTDGSGSGTVLVKKIYGLPESLTRVGAYLYFSNGYTELWESDGTRLGTKLIKDFPYVRHKSTPHAFTASGHTLFFVAHDGKHGCELWKVK